MLQHCQLFILHVEHTAAADYYVWCYGLIIASVYTINQNNSVVAHIKTLSSILMMS